MYKSSTTGSIWVPIKVFSWGWAASATKNGSTWSLDAGSSNPGPTGTEPTGYPTWTTWADPDIWE